MQVTPKAQTKSAQVISQNSDHFIVGYNSSKANITTVNSARKERNLGNRNETDLLSSGQMIPTPECYYVMHLLQ